MTCKWTLLRKTCNSYSGTVPRELPVSSKQETKGKSRRVTTTRRRTHTRAAAACATSAEETESMRQQRINVLHLSLTVRIHLFLFSVQPHANTSSQTPVPNSHANHSRHCSNARTLRQELGVGWKRCLVVNTQIMPCFLVLHDTWLARLENRRSLKKNKPQNPHCISAVLMF